MVLAIIFVCIFSDLDPANSFKLRLGAREVAQQLGKIVETDVKTVSTAGFIATMIDNQLREHSGLRDYGVHMVQRLLRSGLSVKEITWSQILPTAGAMVANQAQVVRMDLPI